MKSYKVHKALGEIIDDAYDHPEGTVHFNLFDGREVCVTDFGSEFRVSTNDPKNPEQYVNVDELRLIMHADEEAEYDR